MKLISKNLITIVIFIFLLSLIGINSYIYYEKYHLKQQSNYNLQDKHYNSINLLTGVIGIIKHYYYKDIHISNLIEYSVQGMLQNLDPYSYILTKEETNDLKIETQGELIGLGLYLVKNQSYTEVVNIIENSPADKAGIKIGDYITHINNTAVNSVPLDVIYSRLVGEKDTYVTLKILRYPNTNLVTTLKRENMNINPIFFKLTDDILYIKINLFSKNVAKQLEYTITKLQKQHNITGIIIDIRNNPGGLLEQAVSVVDLFVSNGVIVSIKSKNHKQDEIFIAKKQDITHNTPLVVLINHGSASASEIVSGALKDHNRATLIGTTTYGKGSVQSVIAINQDKFLKLTTGLYFLPQGETIHNKGVTPHKIIFANGSVCHKCSLKEFNLLTQQETKYLQNKQNIDYQLQYAYNFFKKATK